MDLVIALVKTGYADSFSVSLNGINDDIYYVVARLSFEYPIFSRNTRTQHRRALFRRDQAENALDNLTQLVEYPAKNN